MATPKPDHVEVTVTKKTWDAITGIKFCTLDNGTVVISDISETSLFQGTPLKAGYELVSINGILCEGYQPEDCTEIMREVEGDITIVAKELPLTVASLLPGKIAAPDVNVEQLVALLTSMGFDSTKVKQALEDNSGSVDHALEQLHAARVSDEMSPTAEEKKSANEQENNVSTEYASIATKA